VEVQFGHLFGLLERSVSQLPVCHFEVKVRGQVTVSGYPRITKKFDIVAYFCYFPRGESFEGAHIGLKIN
jgi:hypothetical protein